MFVNNNSNYNFADILPLHLSIHEASQLPESVIALIQYYLFGVKFIFDDAYAFPIKDKIRKMCEETEDLRNEIVFEKMKEYQLETDEATMTLLYDMAYCANYSYLYRPAATAVLCHEYTLNFLWENFIPQDRDQDKAQNIFKDGLDLTENAEIIKDPNKLRFFEKRDFQDDQEALEEWQKIQNSFIYRLSKWADLQPPRARINLWYDSALVTERAQKQTLEMIAAIANSRGVDLRLRDIRQLPNIEGEIEHSLHPGTPVYYRVDLLKVLITDYMLTSLHEDAKYCVISDIDVKPMGVSQLFDQRTLNYLDSHGYVFHRKAKGGYENSFFIFNKEKRHVQKIHNEILIQGVAQDLTTLRKYGLDAHVTWNSIADDRSTDNIAIFGSQNIFDRYADFVKAMGEKKSGEYKEYAPRKVVKAPGSQFLGRSFAASDFRSEKFRFIGESNIPYTIGGRTSVVEGYDDGFKQITELLNWRVEPLVVKADLP